MKQIKMETTQRQRKYFMISYQFKTILGKSRFGSMIISASALPSRWTLIAHVKNEFRKKNKKISYVNILGISELHKEDVINFTKGKKNV